MLGKRKEVPVPVAGTLYDISEWRPKGLVAVATSDLVEIDELNPDGRSIGVMTDQAAIGIAGLLAEGRLQGEISHETSAALERLAQESVAAAGIDIEALRAELPTTPQA